MLPGSPWCLMKLTVSTLKLPESCIQHNSTDIITSELLNNHCFLIPKLQITAIIPFSNVSFTLHTLCNPFHVNNMIIWNWCYHLKEKKIFLSDSDLPTINYHTFRGIFWGVDYFVKRADSTRYESGDLRGLIPGLIIQIPTVS